MDVRVIIGRYLNKEVIKTMSVVLMVLLMLFVGQRFVLYLSDAAQGRFASELVLTLLLYQVPVFVSYLLPLSLFLAVLITLGKLHADNEMAVISACGISDRQILSYFIPMILVLSVLTGYLTLFQAPVAIFAQQKLIKEQEVKGDLSLISPGKFQATSDGKRIIYVEEINDDNQLNSIFFVQQNAQSEHDFSLIVSDKGRYWSDENQQNFLVLENGSQYQGSTGNNKLQTMEFERYFMALKTIEKRTVVSKLKAISTKELVSEQTDAYLGELQWRIAAPISISLLVLLALPLARVPPRQGKFAKLLLGLLIYITYMIMLLTMKGAIEDGKLTSWIGTWWVHLFLLSYGYSEFTQWKWLKQMKGPSISTSPKDEVTEK